MRGIWILIAAAGCRQIFGIADPQVAEDADPTIDVRHTSDRTLGDASNAGEVSHFAFDAIMGDKTPDDIGHRDATCTDGSCPTVVLGHKANALEFANPAFAIIPASASSDSQTLTIALWVNMLILPPSFSTACLLDQPQTLSICLDSSGDVTFATTFNNTVSSLTTPHILVADMWAQIAVTFDGQAKTIYVNGVEAASTPGAISTTGGTVYLGAVPNGSGATGSFANADLDELAIYSRALDAAEIAALAIQ